MSDRERLAAALEEAWWAVLGPGLCVVGTLFVACWAALLWVVWRLLDVAVFSAFAS